jgi:hypothetical protein
MIFPKPLDGADVKAQALPLLAAPWLFWALMGSMWAATLEMAMEPWSGGGGSQS